MIEFKLPSLGADMDEGTLLEWRIAPGAAVRRGQVVAVVDTAKAAVDVECWQDGTVLDLLIQPGDKVPVGTPIATLLEAGETAETVQRPAHAAKPARPAAAPSSATSAAP
ncbi:biotin/lipoyl-containing protein, partial [Azotobacter beijerinckii]|uniref:biotin/lipoyl-containing protein n=1 Tax=Azotobacter beijerinckii TaxID=170623 RepID=UPI0029533F90